VVEDEGDEEQRGLGLARFTPHRHGWTGVPNWGLVLEAAPLVCKGNPLHKAMTFGLSVINHKYSLLFKTQVLSSQITAHRTVGVGRDVWRSSNPKTLLKPP